MKVIIKLVIYGRVRSLDRFVNSWQGLKQRKGRIIKQSFSRDGYKLVQLSKNYETVCKRVNRLVAEAFIDNPLNLKVVNHKDYNRENNNVNNLEWLTVQDNAKYSLDKKIIQYDLQGNFIKEWNSISEASKTLNINLGNIAECCKKHRKTAGGYIWKYKEVN